MYGQDNPWPGREPDDDLFEVRKWSWQKFVTIAVITFLVLCVVIG